MDNVLYYEAHVTVEPQADETEFKRICAEHGFRVAELLMKKTGDRSKLDSFCTGRGADRQAIENLMMGVVSHCQQAGIQVWRYKLESTIIDVRFKR